MKIVLHVDRIVLDGLDVAPGDAPRIRAAVERELARLFAGTPTERFTGGATPRLSAPGIASVRGETPEALGGRIAAAVHGGLSTEYGGAARPRTARP